MAKTVSYGIGQYTYDPTFNYLTSLGNTSIKYNYDYKINSDTFHRDTFIKLPIENEIEIGKTYYMEILVSPTNNSHISELNLKLCPPNINDSSVPDFNKFQQIKYLYIPAAGEASTFSFIFSLKYNFQNNFCDFLWLESIDTLNDQKRNINEYSLIDASSIENYNSKNPSSEGWYESNNGIIYSLTQDTTVQGNKSYYKREINSYYINNILNTVNVSLYEVNNLISITDFGIASIKSGISKITGINVIASPKWMFALNGEEIKLDNTGQYELKNYEINSLGLIVKNNKETQSFIIDYEYTITS